MLFTRSQFGWICLLLIMTFINSGCDRQWTGNISGQITDSQTEEPLEGVIVTASSMKNDYSVTSITESDGTFIIHDARWGPNKVEVYHPWFIRQIKYSDVIRDQTVSIDFELVPEIEYVSSEATAWVTDMNGNPIESARVDLYEKQDTSYDRYIYIGTQETITDGTTTFDLPNIYENEMRFYQFRVAAYGYLNNEADVTVSWMASEPVVHILMEKVE